MDHIWEKKTMLYLVMPTPEDEISGHFQNKHKPMQKKTTQPNIGFITNVILKKILNPFLPYY